MSKKILITGAGSGFGKSVAFKLAELSVTTAIFIISLLIVSVNQLPRLANSFQLAHPLSHGYPMGT